MQLPQQKPPTKTTPDEVASATPWTIERCEQFYWGGPATTHEGSDQDGNCMGCDILLSLSNIENEPTTLWFSPLEGPRIVLPWGASCVAQVWKARGGSDCG